jgi:hypothetical protein
MNPQILMTHNVADLMGKYAPRKEPKPIKPKKGKPGRWHLCQERLRLRKESRYRSAFHSQFVEINMPGRGKMLVTREEFQHVCENTKVSGSSFVAFDHWAAQLRG